jgi:spermidine/putrescine transport system permease protein
MLLPLMIMLVFSFGTMTGAAMNFSTKFTIDNYYRLVHNPLYLKVILNSFKLSIFVVLLCSLAGYPTAYWLARRSQITKFVFLCLILVPFWTSVLLRTYAWMLMLQGKGALNTMLMALHIVHSPINMLWTQGAVVVACVQIYLPFMIIPLYAVLDIHDWKLVEAAKNLGASNIRAFWEITLPLSLPGLLVGIVFVFVPVVGEYLVPAMLGGTDFVVVSDVIASNFGMTFNWPLGCAIAIVLSILISIVIVLLMRIAPPWKLLEERG